MDQHRPPLLRRLRLGYRIAFECVGVLVSGIAYIAGGFIRAPHWLVLLVLALAVLPAFARRIWPRTVLALVVIGATVATALCRTPHVPFVVGYVIYLIPLRVPRREALWLLAGALLTLAVGTGVYAGGSHGVGMAGDTASFAVQEGLFVVAAWVAGYVVWQQRAYTATARERAEREVRDQLAAARRVGSEERLQIARELHDVVAHTVSLIAVQAGVANYVVKTHPEEAARALASIETTSRGALHEMQALLAMLRADGTEDGTTRQNADLLPAPGLADLDDLVARSSEAGLLVDLAVHGERAVLFAGVDLAAYRVIQEAITNVVKHAATDRCRVTVSYREDSLAVQVTDDGAGTAGEISRLGHGIVGMRERVGMYGGEFQAAPLPGRGFQVTARFPLTATES